MSSLGQLNVQIGATIDPLLAGLESAKTNLNNFSATSVNSFGAMDTGAASAAGSVMELQKQLDLLIIAQSRVAQGSELWGEYEAGIQATGMQIQTLEQADLDLATANQTVADSANIAADANNSLGAAVQGTTFQSLNLDRGIGQLALGLQHGQVSMFGMMSAMRGGIGAFQEGTAATGELAGGFQALGASLISPESLIFLVAIGIAELANNMLNSKPKIDEAAKALDGFEKSAAKAMITLQQDIDIAKDTDIAYDIRKKSVDALRESYGPYLKNLSDEQILEGKLGTAIDDVNNALIAKVALQALQEKLLPLLKEEINNQLQINSLNKISADLNSVLGDGIKSTDDKTKILMGNFASGFGRAQTKVFELAVANQGLKDKIDGLIGSTKDLVKQTAGIDFKGKLDKSTKSISDILAELQSKLDLLNKQQLLFGTDEATARIGAIKSAINSLLHIKVSPSSSIINSLIGQIDEEQVHEQLTKLVKKATLDIHVKLPVSFSSMAKDGGFEKMVQNYVDDSNLASSMGIRIPASLYSKDTPGQLRGLLEKIQTEATDMGIKIPVGMDPEAAQTFLKEIDTLASSASKAFTTGLKGLGDSIGNAFSGQKNPLKALSSSLGSAIKALGAQMIEFGVVATGIKQAMNALFTAMGPAALIAGGVALEILGTVIASTTVHPHAEGGIFTQPTLLGNHLFGEAGPEAIVPLNRLQDMTAGMGGQRVEVTGESRIEGTTLVTLFTRAQARNNRNYGGDL